MDDTSNNQINHTPTQPSEPVAISISEPKPSKKWLIFLIIGIILFIGAIALLIFTILKPVTVAEQFDFPTIPSATEAPAAYSVLTGEPISDANLNSSPIYCVQTPNGTDGARPQAGLNQAGVVFEAIAEAGITRFAAVYQNPTSAVIGPIRSLRMYYLEWDTPFDCTIVHAGGAPDALAAVANGGYKDLTENYTYMYRGNYAHYDRLWNNLFTTSSYLKQFSADRGYTTSNPKGLTHSTPEEAKKAKVDALVSEKLSITTPTAANTAELTAKVPTVYMNFGGWASFNLVYNYNLETNSYNRSYASGYAHEVYACPGDNLGEVTPESSCTLTQLSPSVIIAMVVEEHKASDNYHEDITTTGTGTAYVFQNGIAIKGTWEKPSTAEQLKFYDENHQEIALNPGQTWITAVPNYGSVEY